jgi:hypothetical protein
MGGFGEGPGELQRIDGLAVSSDGRIVVGDGIARRITQFDSLGHLIRETNVEGPLPRSPVGLGHHSFLGRARAIARAGGPRPDRTTDTAVVVDFETGLRRALGTLPGPYLHWVDGVPLGKRFSPVPQVLALQEHAVLGSPEKYALRSVTASGTLKRIARVEIAARAVDDEAKEPYLQEWAGLGREPFLEPAFVDSLPHFVDGLADDRDRIWLRTLNSVGRPSNVWARLGVAGAFDGRWAFPAGFVPHDFRDGLVVGVHTDDLGVESVHVYRLNPHPT